MYGSYIMRTFVLKNRTSKTIYDDFREGLYVLKMHERDIGMIRKRSVKNQYSFNRNNNNVLTPINM
jgi:hypothetical protein